MVEIKKCESRKDFKRFVKFPAWLYRGNKCYVPPFEQDELDLTNPKKNACFEESEAIYFLAFKDGKLAGRIAGIISHAYNEKNKTQRARFSRFECINDREVADALLKAAEDWAKSKGMVDIHGPLGFNDLEREGLLVSGFDKEGCYLTSYNKDYYQGFIEANGYTPDAKWVEWRIPVPKKNSERAERVAAAVEKRYGFYEKQFKTSGEIIDKYGAKFFELLDLCYKNIYGTIPFNKKLVNQTIKSFKLIIDKKYVSLIFNKEDELIGFGVGFPSIARALNRSKGRFLPFGVFRLLHAIKHPKVLELGLIAVHPDYQKKGVTAIIIRNMLNRMIENNIVYCDTGCQLENNTPAIESLDMFERELIRRKTCYIKTLSFSE